jgi:hypothetical protein
MDVFHRLPKNFRDMTQVHLATQPRSICNPCSDYCKQSPSSEATKSRFVVWPFNISPKDISEDGILHSHRREDLKSYINLCTTLKQEIELHN